LKESTSAHDLKGLHLIADLYVLIGIVMIFMSLFLLLSMNLYGLLFTAMGIFVIGIGHYLDDLKVWAWWGALLGNVGCISLLFSIIVVGPFQDTTTTVYSFVQACLQAAMFVYLLKPSVRGLFFVREKI
jgi:peptidoglycan/LPS O-acetylase OafA/YrhL